MLNSFRVFVAVLAAVALFLWRGDDLPLLRAPRSVAPPPAPAVDQPTVISPSADAVWLVGADVTVAWAFPIKAGLTSFRLDAFSPANKTYPLLRLAERLRPDATTFALKVPPMPSGRGYFVRVVAFREAGRPLYALSPAFAVGALEVDATNFTAGRPAHVTLSAVGWGALAPVNLELVNTAVSPEDEAAGSLRVVPIAKSVGAAATSVNFDVPFTLPEACTYAVRATSWTAQDPRSGVVEQRIETISGPLCISSSKPVPLFHVQVPAPGSRNAPTEISFTYSGPTLSSWSLDLHCTDPALACFLGVPLARDVPMTRRTSSLQPPVLHPDTPYFLRLFGDPAGGSSDDRVEGTTSVLWTPSAMPWFVLQPGILTGLEDDTDPALAVVDPARGSAWIKSKPARVRWAARGAVPAALTVELHSYDLFPRTLVATVATGLEGTRRSLAWRVPPNLPGGQRYAVRVWAPHADYVGTAHNATKGGIVEAVGELFTVESWAEGAGRRALGASNRRTGPDVAVCTAAVLLCARSILTLIL